MKHDIGIVADDMKPLIVSRIGKIIDDVALFITIDEKRCLYEITSEYRWEIHFYEVFLSTFTGDFTKTLIFIGFYE